MDENKKILLVDDDPDFIEINRIVLESAGYEVDEATTSKEGLVKVLSNRYDAVILDLIMEEKDSGFTFTYEIRKRPELAQMPILMLTSAEKATGFTFQPDSDKEWMKVDDFAAKPLKPAELLQKVARLLSKKG